MSILQHRGLEAHKSVLRADVETKRMHSDQRRDEISIFCAWRETHDSTHFDSARVASAHPVDGRILGCGDRQ